MEDATYDWDAEEQSSRRSRPGLPVEPRRILRVLLPHRRRLLQTFLVACACCLLAAVFLPETYESTAVVLYEGSPLPRKPDERRHMDPRAFQQSAVVPGRLREVRDRLGWDVSLEEIASQVRVTEESKEALRLSARGGTPEEAHQLASAMLEVFLAHQAAFNKEKLERLVAENDRALARAHQRREAAQEAFNAFSKKSGKPDLLDEKAQLVLRAADLRTKADEAAVEIVAQRALVVELEQAQRELPAQIVASAKKGSAVEGPLAKARSDLAEARATLSEEHPRVQALKQRVASLQKQKGGHPVEVGEQTLAANPARTDVDRQLASARAALAAAEERESALRVLLGDVQREIDALAPEEGEARQVIGELEAAIERADWLTARDAKLRDASHQPLTGFRVLSAPALPEESTRASPYLFLLFSLPFLVVLLHAVVLLARSLRTLHVEAPREVAWWGNGPVLGTSVWPRDPGALDAFVEELEDQAVYGAGRTLVVPATEAERDIACSFATRLADAPWLAAAILDVGDRAGAAREPAVTPAPPFEGPIVTPAPPRRPRRLSSQGIPSVAHGRAVPHKPTIQGIVPPTTGKDAPQRSATSSAADTARPSGSRPPRKKTVIGLPTAETSEPIRIQAVPIADPPSASHPGTKPVRTPSGLQPFKRKRGARATVRMVVPVQDESASAKASATDRRSSTEEAFLLTRPVPVSTDEGTSRAGRAVHLSDDTARSQASNAVMRAAVRLLGDDDEDVTQLRRSEPPPVSPVSDEVTGVALAWNGPLTGPVLRRAARLAHRVVVVVSSGLSVVDLSRIRTRLGRAEGVGYVLVNLEDGYVDVDDRVGPVEEFWRGELEGDAKTKRLP